MAEITTAAHSAATALANTPSHVLTTALDTAEAALDAVRTVVDTGEQDADALIDAVKASAPTLVEPALQFLHLSAQKAATS